MCQNDVLCRGHCESAIVCIESGDVASDGDVWISLHVNIAIERDQVLDVTNECVIGWFEVDCECCNATGCD